MEQVCSALNLLCEEWQEERRGTSRRQQRLATLRYHQRRNRAARESRQKGYLANRYDGGIFRGGFYTLMRWDPQVDVMRMVEALAAIGVPETARVLTDL